MRHDVIQMPGVENQMATQTMEQHALITGKTFCWHELFAPTAQEAIAFYTKALDFGTEDSQMDNGTTYHMLTKDGMGVAGVWGTTENEAMKGIPPHWATFLAVDDVDRRVEKCVELGAKLHAPAMDVPKVGRMALIEDPFGAFIWLFKSSM